MDRNAAVEMIDRYVSAFNARDFESIDLLLDEGMTLVDWDCEVSSRAAVVAHMRAALAASTTIPRAEVLSLVFDEERRAVCVELAIDIGAGKTLEVVDVVRFNSNGLIASLAAYRGRASTSAMTLS